MHLENMGHDFQFFFKTRTRHVEQNEGLDLKLSIEQSNILLRTAFCIETEFLDFGPSGLKFSCGLHFHKHVFNVNCLWLSQVQCK